MSKYAKPTKQTFHYSGYRNMQEMVEVYGLDLKTLKALYSRAYDETSQDPAMKGYDEMDFDFDLRLFDALDHLVGQQILGNDMTQTATMVYC